MPPVRTIRQRVLLACGWTTFFLCLACLALTLPPVCGLPYVLGWFNRAWLGSYFHLWLAIGSICGLPLSVSLIYTASLMPDRRGLERLCPHCGYDLRGNLSTAICPECGGAV